jgi:hypothetical protein
LKFNIANTRPAKPVAYKINPTMNALELIFKGVRIIRIRQARENTLPMIVKTLCFLLQPDLSNSRATTSLGKTSSRRP